MHRPRRTHRPTTDPEPAPAAEPALAAEPAPAMEPLPATEPVTATEPVPQPAAASPALAADPAQPAGPPIAVAEPEPDPASHPRHRTRRRLLLAAGALVGAVTLALMVAVGVVAFQQLYDTFGAHPEQNAREWAAREPHYTLAQGSCRSCHYTETMRVRTSWHQDLDCETCHGPQAAHATAATATTIGAVEVEKPRRDICSTCHQQVAGRPDSFPQVDKSVHYKGASCAQCHGVHAIIAARPPDITHPRSHLPDCIVCHAPEGIKGLPDGHQSSPDAVCLSCHKPGRQLEIAGLEG